MFNLKQIGGVLALTTIVFLLFSVKATAQNRYTGASDIYASGSKGISNKGLVVSFDFETFTDTGLLQDFGPYGHHGTTLRNLDTTGYIGKARKFSTLADIVALPDHTSFNLDGPITVAVWVKIATSNQHAHIFACNNKFVLWTTSKGQYKFADTMGNGFTTMPGTVKKDGWHSVVAVWSGTKGDKLSKNNIKIYIDGYRAAGTFTESWEPGEMIAQNACVIGATLHGGIPHQELPFVGAIDELQVYARALSEEEVKIHASR